MDKNDRYARNGMRIVFLLSAAGGAWSRVSSAIKDMFSGGLLQALPSLLILAGVGLGVVAIIWTFVPKILERGRAKTQAEHPSADWGETESQPISPSIIRKPGYDDLRERDSVVLLRESVKIACETAEVISDRSMKIGHKTRKIGTRILMYYLIFIFSFPILIFMAVIFLQPAVFPFFAGFAIISFFLWRNYKASKENRPYVHAAREVAPPRAFAAEQLDVSYAPPPQRPAVSTFGRKQI